MKNSILHHLEYFAFPVSGTRPGTFRNAGRIAAAFTGLVWGLALSFSSMAAVPVGTLEGADEVSVYGWAWDSDNYNHIIPIEISVYPSDSSQILKTDTIKGDHYQDKLQESIGDGYHGFLYSIDWNQFDQTRLRVTAYAVTESDRVFLGELTYNKETKTHTPVSQSLGTASSDQEAHTPQATAVMEPDGPTSKEGAPGPGGPGEDPAVLKAPPAADPAGQEEQKAPEPQKSHTPVPAPQGAREPEDADTWDVGPGVPPNPKSPKGESLGMFITTGYCNCDSCSSGSNLTYSGTVPQPGHTISADMNLFPMGTRLMIDDVIYTVEDIGSSVTQNKIDIFYATHEEAANHGTQEKEVFTVID